MCIRDSKGRVHQVLASLAHADRLLFLLSWLPLLLWWLPPLLSWLPPPRSWLPPPLSWLPPVGGRSSPVGRSALGRSPSAGPSGIRSSTSIAGGRSRRCRASQPGSGSIFRLKADATEPSLSLIHISEPTRQAEI